MNGIKGALLIIAGALFAIVSNMEESAVGEIGATVCSLMLWFYGWWCVVLGDFAKHEKESTQCS